MRRALIVTALVVTSPVWIMLGWLGVLAVDDLYGRITGRSVNKR